MERRTDVRLEKWCGGVVKMGWRDVQPAPILRWMYVWSIGVMGLKMNRFLTHKFLIFLV